MIIQHRLQHLTPPKMEPITIALALIWKEGRLLISRRRPDQHLGGLWEFPGGKCEPRETPEQCAVREALEEVGVICRAETTRPVIVHSFPGRSVRLVPVDCRYIEGEAQLLLVDEVRWVSASELAGFQFPEANNSLLVELVQQMD